MVKQGGWPAPGFHHAGFRGVRRTDEGLVQPGVTLGVISIEIRSRTWGRREEVYHRTGSTYSDAAQAPSISRTTTHDPLAAYQYVWLLSLL